MEKQVNLAIKQEICLDFQRIPSIIIVLVDLSTELLSLRFRRAESCNITVYTRLLKAQRISTDKI